jgi:hypothetical protein
MRACLLVAPQELADGIIVTLMGMLSDPEVRYLVRPACAMEKMLSVMTSQISTSSCDCPPTPMHVS